MSKFLKNMFLLAGTAAAGYLGLKTYKKVNSLVKLSKSLPEFLKNVYGEKPSMHVNMSLNRVSIKAGFPAEILEKHDDIETTIKEYVEDFYPSIGSKKLEITTHVKSEDDDVEEDDDSCCCCGKDDSCCSDEPEDKEE